MRAGRARAISASSVVQGTSMASSQAWPSQPPAPSAAATNSAEAVETVGLAELIRSVTVPARSPQAASTSVTPSSPA